MNVPAFIALSGGTRKRSYNAAVLRVAVEAASAAGAMADLLEPGDFILPLFNPDLESAEGMPQAVEELRAREATGTENQLARPPIPDLMDG